MNCLHCKKPVEGKRNTKRYCSNTCKQYAYLNRSYAAPLALVPSRGTESVVNEKGGTVANLNIFEGIQNDCGNDYSTVNLLSRSSKNQEGLNKNVEYQYIYPDILDKIQEGFNDLKIGQQYFSKNAFNGGHITDYNFAAFSYILPRMRCIIENLFQLRYKSKVHYKTVQALSMAVEEMLLSDLVKTLPNNFPFLEDLFKLYNQFIPIVKSLEDDKDGIRFTMNNAAIIRYVIILYLLRNCTKKEPFSKLFPEIFKSKHQKKANNSKT